MFSSHVLAFQGVRTGDHPFQLLSQLGGILRGYAANRYRNKNLLAGQVEYRSSYGGGSAWLALPDMAT